MKKNYLSLVLALMLVASRGFAQAPCATDEMHKFYKQQNPAVQVYEDQLNKSIKAFIAAQVNAGKFASKTTATRSDTDFYDIPVVVHIIHNYGGENLKDSNIYAMIAHLNKFYNKQSALSTIIEPFKKYIGNAKMRFHLATIDPLGNPTKGITKRISYLTYGGDDQAKMDQWPPTSYFNIWTENVIGRGIGVGIVLAYATFPASGAAFPYSDGVISRFDYINDDNTIEHETGHYFDLAHPWNSGEGVGEVCGDDEVDDTPPTKGHFSVCGSAQLYDTTCASNYFKLYASASGMVDSVVNYPDTTNTQNIMDYSQCAQSMLTIGQVWRMRAALNSTIGGRSNLWDSTNLAITGALAPYPDLKPVTDFCVRQGLAQNSTLTYFTFPGVSLHFSNKSWQDTITAVNWTFSNGASKPTQSFTTLSGINNSFENNFSEPGWVNMTLEATGNNSGTTSTTYPKAVFVADNTGVDALSGYFMEFNPGADRDKWPMFNYYNNGFKWDYANVGYYDNTCIKYQGFDKRAGLELLTGTPKGDFDDLYSVPFDLTGLTSGNCNLNFHYSGASRTSASEHINDSLFIDYSIDKKHTWVSLAKLGKGTLLNKGALSVEYVPISTSDWAAKTISIPAAARNKYTVFRFRYKPGIYKSAFDFRSSGNNFYLDRVHVSPWTAEVSDLKMGTIDVKVVPNPTQGDAYVVVKDVQNSQAQVVVMDITGKVVYTITEQLKGNAARILIPHDAIATPGIYLVQTMSGSQSNTQKLVVY
ncbi:MAG: zinc-dependent metalloprotease [Taibaiella sp.]|nr:zinc-dependent metalloprotease [Taibaiella sp.]